MKEDRSNSRSENHDDSRRYPNSYPSVFPVALTHSEFPSDGNIVSYSSFIPISQPINLND